MVDTKTTATRHQPPIYLPASPSKSNPSRPLSLHRTNSRHLYDADTNAVDSEFAIHSSIDDPQFQKDLSKVTRPRSRGGGEGEPKHQRQASKETGPNQIREWEENDAEQRRETIQELEEIRQGGDGRKAEREYRETIRDKQGSGPSARDPDSCKDSFTDSELEAQTLTGHSSQLEHPPLAEKAASQHSSEEKDPNLVTWESEDDPANPRNWSKNRKWAVTSIVSSYTFLSPLSSSMIAPALPVISEQFHVTNSALQSLMLSVFVLAYAFGPLLLAPLSELYGRKIVLTGSNIFFLIFTVACAVSQSSAQLTVFRFLAGLGGSAPLAVGGGTLSDLFTPEERGGAMAVYSLAPLLGPVVGPIMGAWITQCTGKWRWIFGATCIAMGVVAVTGFILLPETYQPRILAVKAAKLRKESGNEKLKTIFQKDTHETFLVRLRHNLVRPFVLIGTQPVLQAMSLIMCFLYGTMYLLLTTFDAVFKDSYGESTGIASLNYISLGIGFALGGQIGGRGVDRIYRRLKAKNGGVGRPEFKLPLMIFSTWMLPAGMLIYGWSAEYKVHWIVPNIGAAIFGCGMLFSFLGVQNYMVDSFALYAASALSAVSFLRSLAGFGFPLFAPAMYNALGYGWGNSVLALVALIVGIPAPLLMWRYGAHLRSKSSYASQAK